MRSGRCGGGQAVGETQNRPFQLSFNSLLKVDFQGSRVTSDGGLVLVRELDERLGLSELMDHHLGSNASGITTPMGTTAPADPANSLLRPLIGLTVSSRPREGVLHSASITE